MSIRRNRSIKDQLESSFARINGIEHGEIELRADFARYLCVQISGFLEQSIRNLIAAYAEKRAHPTVVNFVVKATGRLMNLDTEKIKEHLLKFDPAWQSPLDALLAGEAKDAINSVVALRNRIAHGDAADVTPARVMQYFKQVAKVIAELEVLLEVAD